MIWSLINENKVSLEEVETIYSLDDLMRLDAVSSLQTAISDELMKRK